MSRPDGDGHRRGSIRRRPGVAGHARDADGRCHRRIDRGGDRAHRGDPAALRAGVEGAAGRVTHGPCHRHHGGGGIASHVSQRRHRHRAKRVGAGAGESQRGEGGLDAGRHRNALKPPESRAATWCSCRERRSRSTTAGSPSCRCRFAVLLAGGSRRYGGALQRCQRHRHDALPVAYKIAATPVSPPPARRCSDLSADRDQRLHQAVHPVRGGQAAAEYHALKVQTRKTRRQPAGGVCLCAGRLRVRVASAPSSPVAACCLSA